MVTLKLGKRIKKKLLPKKIEYIFKTCNIVHLIKIKQYLDNIKYMITKL